MFVQLQNCNISWSSHQHSLSNTEPLSDQTASPRQPPTELFVTFPPLISPLECIKLVWNQLCDKPGSKMTNGSPRTSDKSRSLHWRISLAPGTKIKVILASRQDLYLWILSMWMDFVCEIRQKKQLVESGRISACLRILSTAKLSIFRPREEDRMLLFSSLDGCQSVEFSTAIETFRIRIRKRHSTQLGSKYHHVQSLIVLLRHCHFWHIWRDTSEGWVWFELVTGLVETNVRGGNGFWCSNARNHVI